MLSFRTIKKTLKTWHKLYTRIFISIMLSFSLTMQTTYAAAQATRISAVQDLISKLGMNKKEVSLRQFYIETYNYLPNYVRSEIQAILEIEPDAKLPKVSLQRVKGSNGKEDLQITWANSEAAGSFRVLGEDGNQIAKVGKETLTEKDFNGNKFDLLSKTANGLSDGKMAKWEQQDDLIRLLSVSEYSKLNLKQRQTYHQDLKKLINISTTFQTDILKAFDAKKTSSIINELLNSAQAQLQIPDRYAVDSLGFYSEPKAGNKCLIGGYFDGVVQADGSCKSQTASSGCQGDMINCNPLIYGQSADKKCVQVYDKINPTNACDNEYKLPNWSKSLSESDLAKYAETKQQLLALINNNAKTCQENAYPIRRDEDGNIVPQQRDGVVFANINNSGRKNQTFFACNNLFERLAKLNMLTCLDCHGDQSSGQKPNTLARKINPAASSGTADAAGTNQNPTSNSSVSSPSGNGGNASTTAGSGSLTPSSASIPTSAPSNSEPPRAGLNTPADLPNSSAAGSTGASKPDAGSEQKVTFDYKTTPDGKVVAEAIVPGKIASTDKVPEKPPVDCKCGEGWSQNVCSHNNDGTTTVRYTCGQTVVRPPASGGTSGADSSGTIKVTGSAQTGFNCINPDLRSDSNSGGYASGASGKPPKRDGWWKRNKGWVLGTILTLSIAGLLTWGIIRWTKRKKPNVQPQTVPLDPSPVPPVPRADGTN